MIHHSHREIPEQIRQDFNSEHYHATLMDGTIHIYGFTVGRYGDMTLSITALNDLMDHLQCIKAEE